MGYKKAGRVEVTVREGVPGVEITYPQLDPQWVPREQNRLKQARDQKIKAAVDAAEQYAEILAPGPEQTMAREISGNLFNISFWQCGKNNIPFRD